MNLTSKVLLSVVASATAMTLAWAATRPTVSIDEAVSCKDDFSNVDLQALSLAKKIWPSCYTSPATFGVKIYAIRFLPEGDSLEPVLMYQKTNPEYVDLAAADTTLLNDFAGLPSGTYKAIELVVDSTYRIKVDELFPGGGSRLISKVVNDTGTNYLNSPGLTNINFSGDGSPSLQYVLPNTTDTSLEAETVDVEQKAFWYSSDTISIEKFRDRAYAHKATWTLTDNPVISSIVHFLNLDTSGNLLDFVDLNNSGQGLSDGEELAFKYNYPDTRGTITLNLREPFVYDNTKGLVVEWKWDIRKMFWVGFSSEEPDANVQLITFGPYSFSLSLTEVDNSLVNEGEVF